MRDILLIAGLIILGIGLRNSCSTCCRKSGGLLLFITSICIGWILFKTWWGATLGLAFWLFLPWIYLLLHSRELKFPLKNRLSGYECIQSPKCCAVYNLTSQIEDADFDFAGKHGWEWAGMKHFIKMYWHPEERAVAMVSQCEQDNIVFVFLSITSYCPHGRILRTTNYPFSPAFRYLPHVSWNHVPCEQKSFPNILQNHRTFLTQNNCTIPDLLIPDPDQIANQLDRELREVLAKNLEWGILTYEQEGYYRYTLKGLNFLWLRLLKDSIRLF